MTVSIFSAGVALVAALVALFTSYNARRSALTARRALAETQRQNRELRAQWDLDRTERVLRDATALIHALDRELPRSPGRVEPFRDSLRLSAQAAGAATEAIRELLATQAPPPVERVERIKGELLARIGTLERELEAARRGNTQISRGGSV